MDVQIRVPHGTRGLQWTTLARSASEDQARLITEVSHYETRTVASTDAPAGGLSHPVPNHGGLYCVWMQHPIVINNKKPWGCIADGLTVEHVSAFALDPAQRLSIQPSRMGARP